MVSQVKFVDGLPTLCVNGEAVTEMAYITYNTKNNRYADFAKAGVKLYSVNLNFSEVPIGERAPVLVFQKGIFENDEPDFSIVDENFDEILSVCPDALIFPRVNTNLSLRWEREHPDELCERGMNGRTRFSLASDVWAQEVKEKLVALIDYIENSRYAENVIGYQIAGENTEEWLPFEDYGFYGKRAKEKFLKYCAEKNIGKNEENYFRFASEMTAQRIIEFATVAKEKLEDKKIIGAFYGYTVGCPHRAQCHLALDKILQSDRIDFLCSPLNYVHGRAPGLDPYPMVPIDSLKLHGKLYFSENDIRTHHSRPPSAHPHLISAVPLPTDTECGGSICGAAGTTMQNLCRPLRRCRKSAKKEWTENLPKSHCLRTKTVISVSRGTKIKYGRSAMNSVCRGLYTISSWLRILKKSATDTGLASLSSRQKLSF